MRKAWVVAALGVATLAPGPLRAQTADGSPLGQDPVILRGFVVDESSFLPIDSATVTVIGTELSAMSGPDGFFSFPEAPPFGIVSLRVSSPAHASMVQEVEIRPDRILQVQFQMTPISAVLSELLIGADREDVSLGTLSAADLLAREVPGVVTQRGWTGDNDQAVRLRGIGSFTQELSPLLFVDGVQVAAFGSIMDVLRRIPAQDVEEIEVLRGPAAAFLHAYAANGVIHVRTKEGGGDPSRD